MSFDIFSHYCHVNLCNKCRQPLVKPLPAEVSITDATRCTVGLIDNTQTLQHGAEWNQSFDFEGKSQYGKYIQCVKREHNLVVCTSMKYSRFEICLQRCEIYQPKPNCIQPLVDYINCPGEFLCISSRISWTVIHLN